MTKLIDITLRYTEDSTEKYRVQSIDSVNGAILEHLADHILTMIPINSRKTMLLSNVLDIVLSGRYELSINVRVDDGLANGASGVVQAVQLTGDCNTASGIVLVKFDQEIVGSKTRQENETLYNHEKLVDWTPIYPGPRQFQVGRSANAQVMRKQFPLRHSAAKTVHRCQGDMLDAVVVDMSGKRKEAHFHYVSLAESDHLMDCTYWT